MKPITEKSEINIWFRPFFNSEMKKATEKLIYPISNLPTRKILVNQGGSKKHVQPAAQPEKDGR
ncbi:MAG TPA: hypothetical protein DCR87_04300 [Acidobacteria bacterium]|nr:hypothetical protein [Acidobacteriota bacterium]